MTAFVLDASVTAAWLLPDEASDHTRRLYARIRRDEVDPQAPNLWQWDCANIIANGVRRGRIPGSSVEGLWNVLEAVRHRVELHELAHPIVGHVAGVDFGEHIRLAHAARDQLGDLRAEVEDEDLVVLHVRAWQCPGRALRRQGPPGRDAGRR